jgi:hypothetical protein
MVLVRPSNVPVRTRPEDTQYQVGDQVQVRGMVQASKVTVLLRKLR